MKPRHLPIEKIVDVETANAFLFGLIFNQHQKAERAWSAPYSLRERIGSLLPQEILALSPDALLEIMLQPPAVHPFAHRMAQSVYTACELLLKRYEGDASRIWTPQVSKKEASSRLQEFHGIGEHKAKVGVYVLIHELGVSFIDDGVLLQMSKTCGALYRIYGEDE